jgi:hypothetical protein
VAQEGRARRAAQTYLNVVHRTREPRKADPRLRYRHQPRYCLYTLDRNGSQLRAMRDTPDCEPELRRRPISRLVRTWPLRRTRHIVHSATSSTILRSGWVSLRGALSGSATAPRRALPRARWCEVCARYCRGRADVGHSSNPPRVAFLWRVPCRMH